MDDAQVVSDAIRLMEDTGASTLDEALEASAALVLEDAGYELLRVGPDRYSVRHVANRTTVAGIDDKGELVDLLTLDEVLAFVDELPS